MNVSRIIMKNTMSKIELNPKLKEIANRAGYSGLIYEVSAEGLERFAKLIIDECAEVQYSRSCERHGYDKYDDGEAIKAHFQS